MLTEKTCQTKQKKCRVWFEPVGGSSAHNRTVVNDGVWRQEEESPGGTSQEVRR